MDSQHPPATNPRILDLIGVLLVIAACVICSIGLPRLKSDADVLQWLPVHSEQSDHYDLFSRKFQSDDFMVVTWPDCRIDDPRLKAFTQTLRTSESELILSITDGAEIIDQMTDELNLTDKQVRRRLRGIVFGLEDPGLTCAFIELTREGTANRDAVMTLVSQTVESLPGLDQDEVIFGGYPYITTAINVGLRNSIRFFLPQAMFFTTLFAVFCLRNWTLSLIVFVASGLAGAVSAALIPVCGYNFSGLLSIVPALVFILVTSGSIHLVRYSLSVIGDPWKLIGIGWKPCTISSVTTSVGMLSLMRSNFPAIRNFGMFCAIGVIAGLAIQLVIIPWLVTRFGRKGQQKLVDRPTTITLWQRWVMFVSRHRYSVTVLFLTAIVFSCFGLTHLRARVQVENLFRPGSEIRTSLAQLEQQLGPLDQTELLVQFKSHDPGSFLDRARMVRRIQAQVHRVEGVAATYSLVNFLPSQPRGNNLRSSIERETYRIIMMRKREEFAKSNLLNVDSSEGTETWRISLRFPFSGESDFSRIEDDVLAAGRQVIDSVDTVEGNPQFYPRFVYTGKTHLFNVSQRTLLHDLFNNFLMAFLIITPMLVMALRSLALGLIAMIPNVFPAAIVFGGIGWLGFPVDLAIAMTACVALGIAVDDTAHFLIRFRDFGGGFRNCMGPIKMAITECGPAMLATTIISCGGLFVYNFSEMQHIVHFAVFIIATLIVALIADVVMLPALLFVTCKDSGQPPGCNRDDTTRADQA